MSCLPNEYPMINDCMDPNNFVIYSARYKRKKKSRSNLMRDKATIIFAVPRFEDKAFYDPVDCLFCHGATIELAFSLFILVFAHFMHCGI